MDYDFDGIMIKDSIYGVYLDIEYDILRNVASRFTVDESFTYTEQWKLDRLIEMRQVTELNNDIFRKHDKAIDNSLRKEMETLQNEIIKKDIKLLDNSVRRGDEMALKRIIDVQIEDFKLDKNLTRISALESAQQSFLDIINRTAVEVELSTKTPYEALRDSVKEFGRQNIKTVTYAKNGKFQTMQIDSAIKRSVNTRLTQTMAQTQFTKMNEWGVELLEVSSHGGARPNCAPYQGKIYTRGQRTAKYPSFETDSSYGQPDGLLGINCTHVIYPFIEGVSEQTYFPYDKDMNDKLYLESQTQRTLERNIRTTKREILTLKSAGFDAGKEELKLKSIQSKMRDFISETGRKRHYENEKIYA